MSDETPEQAAKRLAGKWSGHGPEAHQRVIMDIAKALSAARSQGKAEGMEAAAKLADDLSAEWLAQMDSQWAREKRKQTYFLQKHGTADEIAATIRAAATPEPHP